jgi:poly-gamma-glutamate capsule biosynthesis protein CapA/YwtB (metallophosphatase superfamily)
LRTLDEMGIKTAGAGRSLATAQSPAILDIPGEGRVLVLSLASPTSGVPRRWAAGRRTAGVNFIPSLSQAIVDAISTQLAAIRQPGDVVVVSIHWGPNWGYEIADEQRRFAHALIEEAGVAIVHGHSSHHPKGVEIHRDSLILYGCGDFLNDYEGIEGHEAFRGDLALMYFATVEAETGHLVTLEIAPLQIHQFRLVRPSPGDVDWLRQTIDRESAPLGTRLALTADGRLNALSSGTSGQSRPLASREAASAKTHSS